MKEIEQISAGTYGCIYYPSLPCKGEKRLHRDQRYMSKIHKRNDGEEEFLLSEKIKKAIPNYSFNFGVIEKSCSVDLEQIKPKHKCENIPEDLTEITSFKVKYFGKHSLEKSLKMWMEELDRESFILTVLDAFTYILYSLDKLSKETNIIHNDIKFNNIMMDEEHHIPIILVFL